MEEDFSFLTLAIGAVERHAGSTSLALRPVAPPLRTLPELPDGIVKDIFQRIPPSDPVRLLRSALACKRWARLIADIRFHRRYREHNRRASPMLGILANLIDNAGIARFIPTGAFRPARADFHCYRAHDSRHGRVLLNRISDVPHGQDAAVLVVWEPTTDERRPLPLLQRCQQLLHWNTAVLCGAAAGTCNHLDCQSGPFFVVLIGIDAEEMFSYIYSSEYDVWSEGTSAALPGEPLHEGLPGALAQNALYFLFLEETRMLKCDLATGSMCVIALPPRPEARSMVLMTMEDGGLGFVEMDFFGRTLCLWAMGTGPEGNTAEWALMRVIHLSSHLAPRALRRPADVVAFADVAAGGVIFLNTTDGLYTFDLKTEKGRRVMSSRFYDIVPYVGFYTPVLRAALTTSGEGSSSGASTSA